MSGLAARIGRWATFCCDLDRFEIRTQDDVDNINARLPGGEDDDAGEFRVYETEADLLAAESMPDLPMAGM